MLLGYDYQMYDTVRNVCLSSTRTWISQLQSLDDKAENLKGNNALTIKQELQRHSGAITMRITTMRVLRPNESD